MMGVMVECECEGECEGDGEQGGCMNAKLGEY